MRCTFDESFPVFLVNRSRKVAILSLVKPDITRIIDVSLEGSHTPLIVILGPTASGKTGLSVEIAKHVGGEIVNADSRQLYRFLDIGTAKITEGEMEGVPHHLLDILDPKEEATVGIYKEMAENVIRDIQRRNKVPLLVGGSMLYLSSITDGLSFGPPVDTTIRRRLEKEYDADSGGTLYRKLQEVDPDAAAGLHPNNKPRVVRAMEIYELLRVPKSKVISVREELRPRNTKGKSAFDLLIVGVERDSEELKERINERIGAMLKAGWIEEVQSLLARGYSETDPGLKSHGYAEIIQYLRELESGGSDPDIETMQETLQTKIAARTRRYAKRQLTWWRGDERIRWIRL